MVQKDPLWNHSEWSNEIAFKFVEMKKFKQPDDTNNAGDENASSKPLYPSKEDIYKKSKRNVEGSGDSNADGATPTGKIKQGREKEDNPEITGGDLDVPGSELD